MCTFKCIASGFGVPLELCSVFLLILGCIFSFFTQPFTEGITNTLVGCRHVSDTEQKDVVLVRIYGEGSDLMIDRQLEMVNMVILNGAGMAQPLHCSFHNGICYGFERGICLDEKLVRQDDVIRFVYYLQICLV